MNTSYQTKTDLLAAEVADDDMIWVIQKEQFVNGNVSMISWQTTSIHITSNRHRPRDDTDLHPVEVADGDMIWVIK